MSEQNPKLVSDAIHRIGSREIHPVGLDVAAWLTSPEQVVAIDDVSIVEKSSGLDATGPAWLPPATLDAAKTTITVVIDGAGLVAGSDYLLSVDFTVAGTKELTAELHLACIA